ncbi:MAG: maleylpyruvate isomerase N-terminal domain-containing protein, partial [Actinomycetota bacterium]
MAVPAPDKQEIIDALDGAARRFILMLRSIEDRSPVAVGHWTIGDVGAHVAWMSEEVYPGVVAGRGTSVTEARGLDGIEEESGRYLRDNPERRPPPLAAQIERGIQEVVEGLDSLDGDPELTWHAGLRLPTTSIAAILLGELLVHGWDIERAAGRTWSIERGDALLVSAGHLPLLPHYVDPESSAEVRLAYEDNLRGLRFALLFDRG